MAPPTVIGRSGVQTLADRLTGRKHTGFSMAARATEVSTLEWKLGVGLVSPSVTGCRGVQPFFKKTVRYLYSTEFNCKIRCSTSSTIGDVEPLLPFVA